MNPSAGDDVDQMIVALLVAARLAGFIAMAPPFNARALSLQLRAGVLACLLLIIMPSLWGHTLAPTPTPIGTAVLALSELLIGAAMGVCLALVFSSLSLAGQMVGQLGGFDTVQLFDPGLGDGASAPTQMTMLLGLAVFLLAGGERMVVDALLQGFQLRPPGSTGLSASVVGSVVSVAAESFAMGLRVALPVCAALLVSSIALGVVGRTLPQLNLWTVGLSVNAIVALLLMAVSLTTTAWLFQAHWETAVRLLHTAWAGD